MKRVILFIDNLGSGGAQRQVANIAIILKNAGYEVSVLVYQDMPFYSKILQQNQVPIVLIKPKFKLLRILQIGRFLNHSNVDAVISFMETPCFIACLSKLWNKKWKLVTTERSAKLSTFTSKRNRFFNLFERFSDAKVGNSENAINMWIKYYPQYKNKYSVIYNYIDVPDEYVNYEHKYLEDEKLKIVVAASYQELKNPLRVIEAINLLNDEQKQRLELNWYGRAEVVPGDTRIYDETLVLIDKYGLNECVKLHSETSSIYKIMSESDVVGLFSTVEGLPNTICEAMTIGKPVIMTKVSDYDVLVSDNGFLCDPNSVESISQALLETLSLSADELERMGKKSKEKAKSLFSDDVILKQWIEIIEK